MIAAAALAVAAIVASSRTLPEVADTPEAGHEPEAPKHEFRGAWLATVYGIDWPSTTGTTQAVAEAQQRELRSILDVLKSAGINAVMFQVRSMSDAMYKSSYEPWSAYLTGKRGEAPAAGWDPLQFAINEAHARGMELHAWVNPFRLSNSGAPAPIKSARGHSTFDPATKGWVISFGQTDPAAKPKTSSRKKGRKKGRPAKVPVRKKWVSILDPGNPGAREHIVKVCREIVTSYDVDGLVFDDYFYPDRLPLGEGYDFAEYQRELSKNPSDSLSQADWRRSNVARTIRMVGEMINREKPWVRFGVSPAGVAGGNGVAAAKFGLEPPSVGHDWMYDRIFCDPIQWLDEGSVDYVSPQLYWASSHSTNPYLPLAQWWGATAAHFGRHCYPSQKILALEAGEAAWREQETQVAANRTHSGQRCAGSIFYSTAHMTGKKASGLGPVLAGGVYSTYALMPPMEWKEAENPGAVTDLKLKGDRLTWHHPAASGHSDKRSGANRIRYVVYAVPDDVSAFDALSASGANFRGEYIVGITYSPSFVLPTDRRKGFWYAVAPYDRYGNEWEAQIVK